MAFRIKGSYIIALGMIAGIGFWMAEGDIVVGGQGDGPNATLPPAKRVENTDSLFKVRTREFSSQLRKPVLEIRGRTEADVRMQVHAETAGILMKRLVNRGDIVAKGDLLCNLDPRTRIPEVAKAKAALAQVKLDFDAQSKLNKKGFSSQTRVNAEKARLDSARADLAASELELKRTEVRAPEAGVVLDPIASVGELLNPGDACVSLINPNPMMLIGQVSERDISKLSVGDIAKTNLITGQTAAGTIKHIASAADAQTRTFRVEIVLKNDDFAIKDGITAAAFIQLPGIKGHLISPAILTLSDKGQVGVRAVVDDHVVFYPVKLLGDSSKGVWVSGLPDVVNVITVGQDYVVPGQKVETVVDVAEAQS